MKKKKIFYGILAIAVLIIAGIGLLVHQNKFITTEEITNFEECANAGYPILESYPRQCKAPDGKIFVEEETCTDLRGDGICQEIVCMAIGCPCPETQETCPGDCKQTSYIFDKSKFCPDYGDCSDHGLESRKCGKIGDCAASCAYGCASKKWMEGRVDCEAIWENFECECIDGICQRKTCPDPRLKSGSSILDKIGKIVKERGGATPLKTAKEPVEKHRLEPYFVKENLKKS